MTLDIEKLIRHQVRVRVGEIIADESNAAAQRVRERIGRELDRIALNVLSNYEISTGEGRLIIEVKKQLKTN